MQRSKWKTLAFTFGLSALALTLPGLALADWPGYTVYPINGFGSNPTQAFAVNAFSQIAGMAQPGSNTQIFAGLFGGAGYTSQVSYVPIGWKSVEFNGINDSIYMVGQANISGHPTAIGCQYSGNIVNMTGDLPYTFFSQALGVNNSGIAVGTYNQEGGKGSVTHTFRWSSISNSRTADWANVMAGGINELGTITATNLIPTNYYHLAELAFIPANGAPTVKTAPGDYMYIYPSGISTFGGVTAIGQTYTQIENNSGSHMEGYAYNLAADQWQVLDGPNSPYYETHAVGVDVWGTRIAGSTVDSNGIQSATVWEYKNGQWVATYVSDLFPIDSNWKYIMATGINTYGAISGWGQHYENGQWIERGFVATPKAQFKMVLPEGPIFGGLAVNPTVRANGQNPFNVNLNLSTSSPLIHMPRQIQMPGFTTAAQFEMDTRGVDAVTTANVTVRFGGLDYTQPVTIRPAILGSLAIRQNGDEGGAMGAVTLRGTAGPSGATVALTSSDPSVVVPATVTIEGGNATANFRISVGRRATSGKVVTITASYCDGSVSQQFTIK